MFGCWFGYDVNGTVCIQNRACWGGVQSGYQKDVYISNYDREETAKHQQFLIALINEITPCEIVNRNGNNYIKFRLLQNYNQSLVLLNFIRNLWHDPVAGYQKNFFKFLKSVKHYKDPLSKMTWANKKAVAASKRKILYGLGHSNVHPADRLLVKKTEELPLLGADFSRSVYYSTGDFLTNTKMPKVKKVRKVVKKKPTNKTPLKDKSWIKKVTKAKNERRIRKAV